MTFKKLLQNKSWSDISSKFLEIYPDAKESIKGYQIVFERLTLMNPNKTDMSIVIMKENDAHEEYIDVSGIQNSPKTEEENYSQGLELTPWCNWLGMNISKESLLGFSEQEIIVHCLREMTFVGFSERDIQIRIKETEKNREQRESMTEAERDEVTASVEKLLCKWRDEDTE